MGGVFLQARRDKLSNGSRSILLGQCEDARAMPRVQHHLLVPVLSLDPKFAMQSLGFPELDIAGCFADSTLHIQPLGRIADALSYCAKLIEGWAEKLELELLAALFQTLQPCEIAPEVSREFERFLARAKCLLKSPMCPVGTRRFFPAL
jgi:hypothetical protein